ncbi:MAG: M28 family peptidase [Actinobacteria bacterium]|nr:M28 family peptidase [Actinomycetota bacterium]
MEEREGILQHTVSASREPGSRRWDRSIAHPARHLATGIGPRPPGSKGENRAAQYVLRELEKLGFHAEAHDFRTPLTTAWAKVLDRLLVIAGALLFPVNGHLSYALLAGGFLAFLLERYGRSPFFWIAPSGRSTNVLIRIPPSREPETRVVLMAHLDSHRIAFYYRPGLISLYRPFRAADTAAHGLLFILFTLAYGGRLLGMDSSKLGFLWHAGLAMTSLPFLSMLALFTKALSRRASPGGNHNGSGVALLLELARNYSRHRPHGAELWFAFTGASEANGRGARVLLRRHRRELRGAYFLVLEGVGRGFPACVVKEGPFPGFHADRRLLRLARRIIDSYAHYSGGLTSNRLYPGEAFHLLSRGHRAMTVTGREETSVPRFWRWERDDQANVDPRNLRLALDFVRALVDAVDHGGLRRGRFAAREPGKGPDR